MFLQCYSVFAIGFLSVCVELVNFKAILYSLGLSGSFVLHAIDWLNIYNMFFFRALPFITLGYLFRRNQKAILNRMRFSIFVPVVLLALSVFEYLLFGNAQFYISSFLFAFYLFAVCIRKATVFVQPWNYIGENISDAIYVVHYSVIIVFVNAFPQRSLVSSIIILICIIAASVLLAFICKKLCHFAATKGLVLKENKY